MGSAESTTRKVSFGLDDGDAVRILRGVKLSEDVLQRMRGAHEIPKSQTKPTLGNKENTAEPNLQSPTKQQPQSQSKPPPQATSRPTAADTSEELKRRYERQQSIIQEELARIARREREASQQDLSRAMQRERAQTRQEADKSQLLGKQLEKKEVELRALDAFYKEQIAQLEKRNVERYKATHEQFLCAATKSESHVRPRSTEAVCTTLQAQILHCYRENRDQTLRCSDLAKEYMQCIDAAKKNLLVNHG
ncbi:MICOS complex subunit mic25a isoform X2 [Clupea harengus]|uniref:MICOS complex subunit mic25a isoform X2 n=1 Tax=Clupea harengus TaxID=7950 RepID=A0A6P3VN47_CLUHA|nr:MICOS complex subunit mic25a isoform X2 [Clupea harengus]